MFRESLLILLMHVALSQQDNFPLEAACPTPTITGCPMDICVVTIHDETYCIASIVQDALTVINDELTNVIQNTELNHYILHNDSLIIMNFQSQIDQCIASLEQTKVVIHQTDAEIEVAIMDIETLTCRADECQLKLNETYTAAIDVVLEIYEICHCNLTEIVDRATVISNKLAHVFKDWEIVVISQRKTDEFIILLEILLELCWKCNTTSILETALLLHEDIEYIQHQLPPLEDQTQHCVNESLIKEQMHRDLVDDVNNLPNDIICNNIEGNFDGCEDLLANLTAINEANALSIAEYHNLSATYDAYTVECEGILAEFATLNVLERKCERMGGKYCEYRCFLNILFNELNYDDGVMKCAAHGGTLPYPQLTLGILNCLSFNNGRYLIHVQPPPGPSGCSFNFYRNNRQTADLSVNQPCQRVPGGFRIICELDC